jgi:hypothetical protein
VVLFKKPYPGGQLRGVTILRGENDWEEQENKKRRTLKMIFFISFNTLKVL